MVRPTTFGKKENEKKKQARRQAKQNRKEERKQSGKASCFDEMIAYVDEHGMITSTPPEERRGEEEIVQENIQISIPRQEAPAILKGRVEYFDVQKGYGFIKNLVGMDKYFFHVNNVLVDIMENDIVTFDLERGKRGMNAVNICTINDQLAV